MMGSGAKRWFQTSWRRTWGWGAGVPREAQPLFPGMDSFLALWEGGHPTQAKGRVLTSQNDSQDISQSYLLIIKMKLY